MTNLWFIRHACQLVFSLFVIYWSWVTQFWFLGISVLFFIWCLSLPYPVWYRLHVILHCGVCSSIIHFTCWRQCLGQQSGSRDVSSEFKQPKMLLCSSAGPISRTWAGTCRYQGLYFSELISAVALSASCFLGNAGWLKALPSHTDAGTLITVVPSNFKTGML